MEEQTWAYMHPSIADGLLGNHSNHTDVDNARECIDWANKYLGECVSTDRGIVGIFIGYSSIAFWVCAQAPQIYLNFKNSTADSLAPVFLATWLAGDITNLLGSILSRQLATQLVTAIYFVIIDVVMTGQKVYYSVRKRQKKKLQRSAKSASYTTTGCAATLLACTGVYVASQSIAGYAMPADDVTASDRTGRVLMAVSSLSSSIPEDRGYPFSQGTSHTIGYALGIVSAALYVASRMPQIIKNFQRQSTGGLSFVMFLMAVLGNLTYAIAIVIGSYEPKLYDDNNKQITMKAFYMDKLPWLIGSVGTLLFDFTIFVQFWVYGDKSVSAAEYSGAVDEAQALLDDEGLPNGKASVLQTPPMDRHNTTLNNSQNITASPLFFPASKKPTSYSREQLNESPSYLI